MFQTNQLIIVGGPTAVGKTTFVNCLRQQILPVSLDPIPLRNPEKYLFLDATQLSGFRGTFVDRLVLHYDFIYQCSAQGGLPYLSELISGSGSVRGLTLCAQSTVLSARISSRLAPSDNTPAGQRSRRLQKVKAIYEDPAALLGAFHRWQASLGQFELASHLIVDATSTYKFADFRDLNDARNILAAILSGQAITPPYD